MRSPEWAGRAVDAEVEYVDLDQWTAQKSRLTARGDRGGEFAIALDRGMRLADGDIIEYEPEKGRIAAVRISMKEVLVADLGGIVGESPETILRTALELGHAVGNQHWAAVVKGTKVYIPLTVDRKVMESVMRTHRIEGVDFGFVPGTDVIPYLAPHEIRRLFGGGGPDGAGHHHDHAHATPHTHPRG